MDKQQWISFLDKPFHNEEEWQMAYKNAKNWGCCAVGSLILDDHIDPTLKKNQNCVAILNELVKKVTSHEVILLGMDFFFAIEQKNIPLAKQLFNRIHKLKVKKAL